ITKRKDGLYMARYWDETPAGKKRRTIYGKKGEKRQDLADRLAEALGDRSRGTPRPPASSTRRHSALHRHRLRDRSSWSGFRAVTRRCSAGAISLSDTRIVTCSRP
ncbi:MAG TPA: hypothetical protein VK359_03320, partial [Rubrobacteraceae bacterium]|nr:hypothetical protein [Rubrobacteraceae bacterium]